jgi:hypothetical protein
VWPQNALPRHLAPQPAHRSRQPQLQSRALSLPLRVCNARRMLRRVAQNCGSLRRVSAAARPMVATHAAYSDQAASASGSSAPGGEARARATRHLWALWQPPRSPSAEAPPTCIAPYRPKSTLHVHYLLAKGRALPQHRRTEADNQPDRAHPETLALPGPTSPQST